MKLLILILNFLIVGQVFGQALLDSYSDGNFTNNPSWSGDTGKWVVDTSSTAAAGASNSFTLRLNATAVTDSEYLSTQIFDWGNSQEWGFFIGRRAQQFSAQNKIAIWLYATESNLESPTVDGYRLVIGEDGSQGDTLRLESVTNGVGTVFLRSAQCLPYEATDIGFLVRLTRSASGTWELFTSLLPTANGTGAIATDVPNADNASISQGTASNASYTPTANGYFGIVVRHTTGSAAIVAAEFDQVYFTQIGGAPYITGTRPADGQAGVGRNDSIVIAFSESMLPDSFRYQITPNPGNLSVSWNARNDTATIYHAAFDYELLYTVEITGACDLEYDTLISSSRSNPFSFTVIPDPANPPFYIVVLDVGQGDATFIKSPSGKTLLFDAGPSNSIGDKISDFIIDSIGIHHLDYIVTSHYHDDHIGGMDQVIHRLGGRESILVAGYDHGGTYNSGAFTEYRDTLGAKRQTISLGQVIDMGSGVSIKCVTVNGQTEGDGVTPSDENDNCVALLVTYGMFSMIVAGDLGGGGGGYQDIETLLAPDIDSVSVLHVNHHGSKFSTNAYWLSVLKPKVSVISVGDSNGYGHPDTLTMDRLMATSTYVYLTEAGLGDGDTVDTGRGRVMNSNIWIDVRTDKYTIGGQRYPLSVEISEFIASALNSGIILLWRTESEENTYLWEIERSGSPYSSFTNIGIVPGHGTTSQPHDYEFIDSEELPAGTYWYRLCEVEIDGDRNYYGPVSVEYSPGGAWKFALGTARPNPFNQITTISYQLAKSGLASLKLYNVLGQEVRTLADGVQAAGAHRVSWDGQDSQGRRVSSGVYFYRLESRENEASGKLLFVR